MLATSSLASCIRDEREHGILQVVVTKEKLEQRFNRPLQNIKKVIYKHWHLLQMKPKLKNAFQERPIIVYKKNGNLEIRK